MAHGFRLYKDDETPLYIQTADALRASIIDGEYRPGDRLPSIRKLSDELGVNPATIVAAYRILTNEGFVEARTGSGAFVSEGAPVDDGGAERRGSYSDATRALGTHRAAGAIGVIDMAANAPPLDMFPLEDIKGFIVEAIDADGGRAFEYQDTGGFPPLRRTMAERLSLHRGDGSHPVDPEDVHIVSGAQQGIDLVARVLLRRGDVAALESPGYRGARDAFVAAGARVEPLPLGDEGIDLHALEGLASSRSLRLIHVNPTFQNPTCAVYSDRNRACLAGLAERYGFYIVEDDLFSDLAWGGEAIPSIRSFDASGRVLFVKSFSKSLMPGLRIACLEAPAVFRDRIEGVKRSVDISSNGLMQRVLDRFLASGRFDAHLESARGRYRAALDAFESALKPYKGSALAWERPVGGFNLWIGLPPGIEARAFSAACLARGVSVAAESSFRHDHNDALHEDTHIRVSFGSVPRELIDAGAKVIGQTALSFTNPAGMPREGRLA